MDARDAIGKGAIHDDARQYGVLDASFLNQGDLVCRQAEELRRALWLHGGPCVLGVHVEAADELVHGNLRVASRPRQAEEVWAQARYILSRFGEVQAAVVDAYSGGFRTHTSISPCEKCVAHDDKRRVAQEVGIVGGKAQLEDVKGHLCGEVRRANGSTMLVRFDGYYFQTVRC